MKLVDILARDLEVWPKKTDDILSQDLSGKINCADYPEDIDEVLECGVNGDEDDWVWPAAHWSFVYDKHGDPLTLELAEDAKTTVVSYGEWLAARSKLAWGVSGVSGEASGAIDLRAARSRVFEIEEQIKALQSESESLISQIEQEGFNLIKDAPKADVPDMQDWRNWKVGDTVRNWASGVVGLILEAEDPDYDGALVIRTSSHGWVRECDVQWVGRP